MEKLIDLTGFPVRQVLKKLLSDKTTKKNIIFATDSYASYGESFQAQSPITEAILLNMNQMAIQPRILKAQAEQAERTRKKAEVFTPAWLCCKMNNFCDEEWFGRKDVFNHLADDNTWTVTTEPVKFTKRKTWKRYVDSRRLEITCGEAPYVVSRYDAATGNPIEIKDRIGILDRKLRVVNENTDKLEDWYKWTLRAFQSVYGYEWQGDSLLIARINLLMTFVEYYENRWGVNPDEKAMMKMINKIANVIAWNFWQMDGLADTVPYADGVPENSGFEQISFFDMGINLPAGNDTKQGSDNKGKVCRIFDWRADCSLEFRSIKEARKVV